MLSWATIIELGLRILLNLFEALERRKAFNEGQDHAIAMAAAEILRKTQFAQKTLDSLGATPDASLDDLLRDLAAVRPPTDDGK